MLEDEGLIECSRTAAPNCQWTASVRTGAGPTQPPGCSRARRRRLTGGLRDNLEGHGVEVADRVVWQGNHISGAGVSAGIDMALARLERVHGRKLAELLQLAIEADPQPVRYGRAPAKADASTLRLALRVLLGERPFAMAARAQPAERRSAVQPARGALAGWRADRQPPAA